MLAGDALALAACNPHVGEHEHGHIHDPGTRGGRSERLIKSTYIALRRVLVLVIGVSVLVVGIIMIVTPGPAIIVIPAGLALLATEFLWARRLLERMKETITSHTRANHTKANHAGDNKAARQPAADRKE